MSVFALVEFIMVQERATAVTQWMESTIGETEIIEHFQTFIRYKVSAGKKDILPVGKIFGALENNKEKMGIQNYSIKQASVEQIFNKFAEEEGAPMD